MWRGAALGAVLALAGCSPLDPSPASWGEGLDYTCGGVPLRVFPRQGAEWMGLRFGGADIQFDGSIGFATAGDWHRTSEFPNGKHTFMLNERRIFFDGAAVTTTIEKGPTSPADAAKLARHDYSHPFPESTPADAPQGRRAWRSSEMTWYETPCKRSLKRLETFSDVTFADIIGGMVSGFVYAVRHRNDE